MNSFKRHHVRLGEGVGADHHLRDGGVEAEFLDVLADLLDRLVHDAEQFLVGAGDVLDLRGNLPGAVLLFLEGHAPDAGEEAGNALDALHAPGFHLFERAHEHFVEAQRVGSVFVDDVVRVHHVAAGLGHLLAVLAEDEALVDESLERLGRGDVAEIEEHLVPEAGVEQVKHGVLGAADVEVDHAGFVARSSSPRLRWR